MTDFNDANTADPVAKNSKPLEQDVTAKLTWQNVPVPAWAQDIPKEAWQIIAKKMAYRNCTDFEEYKLVAPGLLKPDFKLACGLIEQAMIAAGRPEAIAEAVANIVRQKGTVNAMNRHAGNAQPDTIQLVLGEVSNALEHVTESIPAAAAAAIKASVAALQAIVSTGSVSIFESAAADE